VITTSDGQPVSLIGNDDSIIFFNFRPDRIRQLSWAFIDRDFDYFDRGVNPPLPYCVTMTEYDRTRSVPVAFTVEDLRFTLGEVYANQRLTQVRIAETEKYAHVTFFFSGGREEPFALEDRILIPSPKVATYDLQPQMSAPEVTRKIVESVKRNDHQLIVANFANADMVGHTGDIEAAIKAVETVDHSLAAIEAAVLANGWEMIVTADHGNAELMLNGEGETLTAHSANPVPFILVGGEQRALRAKGILADVAPTVLALAGLEQPPAMTGSSMLAEI
jgi:2,3-bisphosphoglycerate-independent phosphoglycerate mutase